MLEKEVFIQQALSNGIGKKSDSLNHGHWEKMPESDRIILSLFQYQDKTYNLQILISIIQNEM